METIEELGIGHMFLVGGFSESPILQDAIREEFKDVIKVIIPQVKKVESNTARISISRHPNIKLCLGVIH